MLNKLPPVDNKTGWPWELADEDKRELFSLNGQVLPKISIVTPSFNQGQFIEETIRSVLLQGYPNLEYFLIDGGSTDKSISIIKKYEPWLTYWESKPDQGQAHAINKGFKRAAGDFVAWLNSDDIYYPGTLFVIAQAILDNPSAIVIAGRSMRTDEYRNTIELFPFSPNVFEPTLLITGEKLPSQPSVFISKQALDDVGELREDLHYVMDWEYWIRVSLQYSLDCFIHVDKTLSAFNEWQGSKTTGDLGNDLFERRKVLMQLFRRPNLSEGIIKLSWSAYTNIYFLLGQTSIRANQWIKAFCYYLYSFVRQPLRYNPFRILVNVFFAIFTKQKRTKIKIGFKSIIHRN